jgi:hypothetical protein
MDTISLSLADRYTIEELGDVVDLIVCIKMVNLVDPLCHRLSSCIYISRLLCTMQTHRFQWGVPGPEVHLLSPLSKSRL